MHTRWVDAALKLRPPSGYSIEWVRGLGWCDARRIHYIIEKVLEADADYVAFIDGDVVVPPEWLETMAKHMESGCRVVASVVPMRGRAHEQYAPFGPMAWNVVGSKLVPIILNAKLQEVDYISLGAVMMEANIFRECDALWTWHEFDERNGYRPRGSTADSILMRNIRKRGIRVYADPSLTVKHLHTFEIDHTFGDRFPEWGVGQQ